MPRDSVLIADDDRLTVQLFTTQLRKLGLDVKVAYDGTQAWMFVQQTAPKALILDFKMPAGGMDWRSSPSCAATPAPPASRC